MMEKLTPTSNFGPWKSRVRPVIESKAAKWKVEAVDLLPLALDDTVCNAFSQWRGDHSKATLDEALVYLETWLVATAGGTTERFWARRWMPDETVEDYKADLQYLASALHLKPADRAFKAKFVDGLPPNLQPLIRLQLTEASWPSIAALTEKVKITGLKPTATVSAATSVARSSEPTVDTEEVSAVQQGRRKESRSWRGGRGGGAARRSGPVRCFNCGGTGHMARQCPSPRSHGVETKQGNGSRS